MIHPFVLLVLSISLAVPQGVHGAPGPSVVIVTRAISIPPLLTSIIGMVTSIILPSPKPTTTQKVATTVPKPTTTQNVATTVPKPTTTQKVATTAPMPTTTSKVSTTVPPPKPTTTQKVATTAPKPTTTSKVSTTVPPPPKPTTTSKVSTRVSPLLELTTTGGVSTRVSPPPEPTTTGKGTPLSAEIDCSDSSWVPSVDAWKKENVDQKLKEWWESVPGRANKSFVTEFGKAFGDHAHNLACGVDTEDQCINPSCEVFRSANAPKWSYFVRVAISNQNRFMRLLHAGVGEGQQGFEALREDVAQNFFPWKDTRTNLEKAAPWLAAVLSTAAAFVPFGFAVGGVIRGIDQTLISGVSTAGAAFAGAAFTQVSLDPAIKPIVGRMRILSELGRFVEDYCSNTRDILGEWSMLIFKGGKDKSGGDIFTYLHGGRFVLQDEWTKSDLEKFFKKRLVAWFVNHEIREHTKTFILCANSTKPESVVSRSESQYITSNKTRVCNLYRLNDKGRLTDLIAVEKLKQPQYSITARDMVQSSVEAYLAGGLDYTAENMTSRLTISAALPSDQQWFSKGAAGEGAFTFPVCDVGENTNWMDVGMPCCCGVGCKETTRFMENANMGSFNPVENECQKLCSMCAAVNYGNDASSLSNPSQGILAGAFLAIWVANFLLG